MNFTYTFPAMDEFDLDNRLRVLCVPDHEQNGIVVALQIPVGRFSDPVGLEGLCELTANLLSKGTASFTSEEFADKLENAGATLFADIGEEHCVLGLRMLASSARSLLPLFIEMLCRPAFAKAEFNRQRQELVTAVQAERIDTSYLVSRHFYVELAGKGQPAGRFQTETSLKKITLNDVADFFNDYFAPDGSVVIVAGDFDRTLFNRFVAEQFSLWRRERRKKAVIAPAVPNPASTVVRLVDKPAITQAWLAVGHALPGELCPEKNTLHLANHIFGGGNFSSRLMTRIRTADGKTYGISSQMLSETEFGAVLITTSTQSSALEGVLASIIEEYRRFYADGVTAEELKKAQQFAIGNMAFQLEGIGNIVDKLLWLRFYGRPNSYIERFEQTIMAIDIPTINSVIRKYLSPENLIISVVGKKHEIEPQLRRFGSIKNFYFRDTVTG